MENLSLLATFDDITRCSNVLTEGSAEIGKFSFLLLQHIFATA